MTQMPFVTYYNAIYSFLLHINYNILRKEVMYALSIYFV